jgi:hypothetical protein
MSQGRLESGRRPRASSGDLRIVVAIRDRRSSREEESPEHVEPAVDRYDHGRSHARRRQHALEIVDAIFDAEIRHKLRPARADHPSGQALV